MLDKLRKQTFKHQGKYLSIKIWLPILEKTYFYTEKNSDGAKKDLSFDEKSIMRSSHEFPRDRTLKLVFKTFSLYSNLLRKKNIFIERQNKQVKKRWEFLQKAKFCFCSDTKHSPVKTKRITQSLGPHLRNDKNKNIREHFDSKGIHISI